MRDLYVVGDVHGKWRELVYKAAESYKIINSDILVLGDFGVGFEKPKYLDDQYKRITKRLENNDLNIHVLRGNHDNPEYFKEGKPDFPRLHFLEDNKVHNLCERRVFIVGGANSTDITERIKDIDWWEGEDIVRISTHDMPRRVDVIATHSAPLAFDPVVHRFEETPPEQYEKILDERRYLGEILNYVKTDLWYYGHFHKSYSGTYNGTMYRCLSELEFLLVPEPKIDNPQGEIKYE